MRPYIGVTGFSKPAEVLAAIDAFPPNSSRQLMIGVLATWKSLRGIPMKPKWVKQTPPPENINDLFVDDDRILNLVHLSTEEGQESSLLADMLRIHDLAGQNFHGFQLNVVWPEIRLLDEYRITVGNKPYVVLQLGQKAVMAVGGTIESVVGMLYHYVGNINGVLFDPSGGLGKPLDTERAREFLAAIAEQRWGLNLGVAGGLGPVSLNLVEPLIAQFPDLNIDAQGRLRNAENDLDADLVSAYLRNACAIFT